MAYLFNPVALISKPFQDLIRVISLHNLYERTHYTITYTCEKFKYSLHPKFYSGLSNLSSQCWKCGSVGDECSVFCTQCKTIQKPNENCNYFDIFGMKQKYEIQHDDLSFKYRKLQNILHPDRFVNSNKEERNISEEYSSLVNKAYRTLLQPLSRGIYMLELHDIRVEAGSVRSDPEFLMDLMERNEEVDQAKDESEIAALNKKNKAMLEELARNVTEAFNAGDLEKATDILIKMKYYESIDTKIKVLKQKKGYPD